MRRAQPRGRGLSGEGARHGGALVRERPARRAGRKRLLVRAARSSSFPSTARVSPRPSAPFSARCARPLPPLSRSTAAYRTAGRFSRRSGCTAAGSPRARMSRRGTPFSARGTVSMRRRCARSFCGSEGPLRARPQRRCASRARARIPLRALRPPGAAGSACASCVPIPATAVISAAGAAPSARCGGERRAENASAACAACISARRARSPFRSVPLCAGTLRAFGNGVRRRCFFEREDFQRVSV